MGDFLWFFLVLVFVFVGWVGFGALSLADRRLVSHLQGHCQHCGKRLSDLPDPDGGGS